MIDRSRAFIGYNCQSDSVEYVWRDGVLLCRAKRKYRFSGLIPGLALGPFLTASISFYKFFPETTPLTTGQYVAGLLVCALGWWILLAPLCHWEKVVFDFVHGQVTLRRGIAGRQRRHLEVQKIRLALIEPVRRTYPREADAGNKDNFGVIIDYCVVLRLKEEPPVIVCETSNEKGAQAICDIINKAVTGSSIRGRVADS